MGRPESCALSSEFKWTPKRILTAQLLAESGKSDAWVCQQVGLNTNSLRIWKQHPAFVARVDEITDEFAGVVRRKGIALLARRIDSYLDDWNRIETIRDERAKMKAEVGDDPAAGGVSTGYITRDYKGKDADRAVYAFDDALFGKALALRKQLSQELGEWIDRGQVQEEVKVQLVNREGLRNLSDAELEQYEMLLSKINGPPAAPADAGKLLSAGALIKDTDTDPKTEK